MVKVSSAVNAENLADFVGHAQALKLLSGLKAGDVVVVSDAQSPLGLGVSRVGKKMGLKVVAVVGGHLQTDVTLKRLRSAGAEIVAAEEYDNGKSYVVSSAFRRLLKDLPGTRVAISGSGGLYAHEIALTLGNQGILYVVGGAPFTLPASLFLEKGIIVRGPETPSAENYEEAANMVKDLSKDIATPTVKFDLFKEVGKAVDALGMGPVSLLKA